MAKKKKDPTKEALKAIARYAALAALPWALTYFQGMSSAWSMVVYFLLVGTDKYVHESDVPSNGLLPF